MHALSLFLLVLKSVEMEIKKRGAAAVSRQSCSRPLLGAL